MEKNVPFCTFLIGVFLDVEFKSEIHFFLAAITLGDIGKNWKKLP